MWVFLLRFCKQCGFFCYSVSKKHAGESSYMYSIHFKIKPKRKAYIQFKQLNDIYHSIPLYIVNLDSTNIFILQYLHEGFWARGKMGLYRERMSEYLNLDCFCSSSINIPRVKMPEIFNLLHAFSTVWQNTMHLRGPQSGSILSWWLNYKNVCDSSIAQPWPILLSTSKY